MKKWVAAIDAASGRMLWKTGDYVGLRSKTGSMDRISHLSMCAGDGQVFFVDRDRIVSLDLNDGREVWSVARPEVPENKMRYNIRITDMCSLVYHDGVRLLRPTESRPHDRLAGDPRPAACLFRRARARNLEPPVRLVGLGASGRRVCGRRARVGSRLPGRTAKSQEGPTRFRRPTWPPGLPGSARKSVVSGSIRPPAKSAEISNFKAFDNGHHHRCYRNKATPQFMMTSYRGLEFSLDGEPNAR